MKLLFRPDMFIDSKGNITELQDIEIKDVKAEGCTACEGEACGYAFISVEFHVEPPTSTVVTEDLNEIWDLQEYIQKTWNAGIKSGIEVFKKK